MKTSKMQPLLLHIYGHIKNKHYIKKPLAALNNQKAVKKRPVSQPSFGHFLLRIQDGNCCAKLLLPNGVFPQRMGHKKECK